MSIQQGQTKSAAPKFGRLDAALADVEVGDSSLQRLPALAAAS